MSTIDLTHEMAEIKEQLTRSAAIRADARQREKEAEEETARSHLRLNNLEIALWNVQCDTERKLKRARLHSERESEPAAEKQQKDRRDKRRMPPPPNPLEITGQIDNTSHHQHRLRAEAPVKAGVKLKHPEPYPGGSDLEEFEGFIANILRWLKMNYLLGPTSTDLQVSYLGTCLTGEAQEWFHRNVEHFDRQVPDWTLETVIQGLQKRFLHALTYHHASTKFDAVMQGTNTVQELMNELTKYAACMIQQPEEYTLRRRFVSASRETLRNEVLKKGYNAETSSLDVLCDTARMIEEASRYNQGMRRCFGTLQDFGVIANTSIYQNVSYTRLKEY
jgi:hypothetical protein